MGALSSHARDPWGCLLWDRPCASTEHLYIPQFVPGIGVIPVPLLQPQPGSLCPSQGLWDPSPSALSTGGICWLQQGKEAKCTMILKTGVTWEECCANGNVDVAWSNYTYPGNKISLLGFLGLVTCHPCKGDELGGCCGECGGNNAAEGDAAAQNLHQKNVCALGGSACVMPKAVERAWPPLGSLQLCLPAESCSSVVCPGTHTCVVDQTGSAHCVMCRTAPCPEPTSLDHALCGNNNVTYPSACHLRRATCHRGRSIGVRHYGSCSGEQGRGQWARTPSPCPPLTPCRRSGGMEMRDLCSQVVEFGVYCKGTSAGPCWELPGTAQGRPERGKESGKEDKRVRFLL
uniref:Follistatin like 3 n=1 Tax=Junco hyemalis TaxID=40217 RepID=A0A8C5IQ43_JUNHY